MDNFALTYLLLTFGGCLGVYQIAAAHARLRGLWFFQTSTLTYFCGALILSGTFVWFFSSTNLNIPHPETEGAQQLAFFLLGAFLALMATFAISSLLRIRRISSGEGSSIGKGIEDLKGRSVSQAFIYRLKNRGEDR